MHPNGRCRLPLLQPAMRVRQPCTFAQRKLNCPPRQTVYLAVGSCGGGARSSHDLSTKKLPGIGKSLRFPNQLLIGLLAHGRHHDAPEQDQARARTQFRRHSRYSTHLLRAGHLSDLFLLFRRLPSFGDLEVEVFQNFPVKMKSGTSNSTTPR